MADPPFDVTRAGKLEEKESIRSEDEALRDALAFFGIGVRSVQDGQVLEFDEAQFEQVLRGLVGEQAPMNEKIAKIEALRDRAGTEGEQQAAEEALRRLRGEG